MRSPCAEGVNDLTKQNYGCRIETNY
jgi:hypothetical protein